jgi:hypothetical protein
MSAMLLLVFGLGGKSLIMTIERFLVCIIYSDTPRRGFFSFLVHDARPPVAPRVDRNRNPDCSQLPACQFRRDSAVVPADPGHCEERYKNFTAVRSVAWVRWRWRSSLKNSARAAPHADSKAPQDRATEFP